MAYYVLSDGQFEFSFADVGSNPKPPSRPRQVRADKDADLVAWVASRFKSTALDILKGDKVISATDFAGAISGAVSKIQTAMNANKKPQQAEIKLHAPTTSDWIPLPKGGHKVVSWVLEAANDAPLEAQWKSFRAFMCVSFTLTEYDSI